MRPLDALLSQPEQRLIATVLTQPDRDFGTLELLARMGSSRGAGSAVLKRWVAAGLLKEQRVGNQRRLAANRDFVLYPELRKIVLKTVGLTDPIARALAPLVDRISEAFIFGSVAAGTDTSDSDIDLAVIGNVDLFVVSPLLDGVEQEIGRRIHLNVYSEKEWSSSKDPVLRAVKGGPRIDLTGALHGKAG